ncbi:MAG: hypothetical protein C0410_01255 [Anaerolinea sp.]|nr:hypothetical protein [Anaerolinea sp.]
MRIVLMNGGLGNQMFQYIFFRWLELNTTDPCLIDDSAFFEDNIEHNGYEIEKIFNLRPKRLSQIFNQELWQEMLINRKSGVSIEQQLQDNGFNLLMFAETSDFLYNGNVVMMPANRQDASTKFSVKNVIGNVYYHGYWITNNWLDDIYPTIKNEFKFPPISNEKNLAIQSKILNTDSCGIHIRRGDFVNINWNLNPEYYCNSIKEFIKLRGKSVHYYVFSDDIDWCKSNEDALGFNLVKPQIEYVQGNCDGVSNYVDMQLLSYCKWLIMSKSAFCYMAALLSDQLKGEINPSNREITHHS